MIGTVAGLVRHSVTTAGRRSRDRSKNGSFRSRSVRGTGSSVFLRQGPPSPDCSCTALRQYCLTTDLPVVLFCFCWRDRPKCDPASSRLRRRLSASAGSIWSLPVRAVRPSTHASAQWPPLKSWHESSCVIEWDYSATGDRRVKQITTARHAEYLIQAMRKVNAQGYSKRR